MTIPAVTRMVTNEGKTTIREQGVWTLDGAISVLERAVNEIKSANPEEIKKISLSWNWTPVNQGVFEAVITVERYEWKTTPVRGDL